MDNVYENIDEYNPTRKRKILIVFDNMIADIVTNKKFQAIIKDLFIRCRTLSIPVVFITQSCFSAPKDVRLNSEHYLIRKINNKKELQNIAINNFADIEENRILFLTIHSTLPGSDSLRFRKNLLPSYKNDSN